MIGLRTKTFLGLGFLFLFVVLLSYLGTSMTHQLARGYRIHPEK